MAAIGVSGPVFSAPSDRSLHDLLGLPDWLTLSLQSRFRYETLDEQFRAGGRGGDQVFAVLTTVLAEARQGAVRVGAEMIDARVYLDDAGTPLDTAQVDTTDLLQAYTVVEMAEAFGQATHAEFRLGRQTLDIGSRRLVARNRFRNTINAFTGLDWKLKSAAGWSTELFVGSPVARLPATRPELTDNDGALDEEDFGTAFWLATWQAMPRPDGQHLEAYVIGLHESDARFATRNRRLVTPGFRWFRDPAVGALDFQLEVAVQAGQSRTDDTPANRRDLDHLAHYETFQVGYTYPLRWSPRLAAMFDYASGDDDPADHDNDRFDTLFGARRFDYGPTGIWGPFIRSNLVSPGVRLNLAPRKDVRFMIGYRAFWLASRRDAWIPARTADPAGRSGRFVGNQVEFSTGWALDPAHLNVEIGGACLLDNEFRRRVRGTEAREDSSYLYLHLALAF